MSDPDDVPTEFAATYHAAYREAIASREAAPDASPATGRRRGQPLPVAASLWSEGWVKAAVASIVAIVLVLGAYGLGKVFATPSTASPASEAASRSASVTATPYRGPLHTVAVSGVSAPCTAPPGVDAGGHRVTYQPRNMLDGDPRTAWRCNGRGVGITLRFRLPPGTTVAAVGLVPGYAKTDRVSGADRYAQNNRITTVRWTIGDRRILQHLSADPHDRSLRLLRVPATDTTEVRLEILGTRRGSRNTTAISDVRIATPGH